MEAKLISYYALYRTMVGEGPEVGILITDARTGDALLWDHQAGAWTYDPDLVERVLDDPENWDRIKPVDRAEAELVAMVVTRAEYALPDEDTIRWLFRCCLVTGATSGIGKATATGLARLGAEVVLVARDPAKGQATAAEIRAATGNEHVEPLTADLSWQASTRQAAEAYRHGHDRLHVLVNNAGGYWATRHLADGLELTFALNHLAYFLLTNLLLDLLRASAAAASST